MPFFFPLSTLGLKSHDGLLKTVELVTRRQQRNLLCFLHAVTAVCFGLENCELIREFWCGRDEEALSWHTGGEQFLPTDRDKT